MDHRATKSEEFGLCGETFIKMKKILDFDSTHKNLKAKKTTTEAKKRGCTFTIKKLKIGQWIVDFFYKKNLDYKI